MSVATHPELDVRHTQFPHLELDIEPYVRQTHKLKLDDDDQICKDFLSDHGCPKGPSCPLRHTTPSVHNFVPGPRPIPPSAHARTVCKHWLRGLCKKGPSCEFLHEYHLRKMPECWFYAKYGFCSNGDECMYLHVNEEMRIRECPQYRKGFCRNGPNCALKHTRRAICEAYLAGFCPEGNKCPLGHARFEPVPEPPASSTRIPDVSGARFLPEATFRLHNEYWLAFAADEKNQRIQANISSLQNQIHTGTFTGRRDLSQVLCFKCGEHGHYANHCPTSQRNQQQQQQQ